jgi:hypothetical protein
VKKDNTNSFRMGTAPHRTEQAVFDVYDEGTSNVGFEEVWENAEDRVSSGAGPSVGSVPTAGVPGSNQVQLPGNPKKVRDIVFDYFDRFPNSGQS